MMINARQYHQLYLQPPRYHYLTRTSNSKSIKSINSNSNSNSNSNKTSYMKIMPSKFLKRHQKSQY